MKSPSIFSATRFVLLAAFLLPLCSLDLDLEAATLTLSPSTISNTYVGVLTLLMTGLTNSESVIIQKYLDVNTNSTLDATDLLTQQFQVKEGRASVIGGVTNVNVPGDTDVIGGQITSVLNYYDGDFGQQYVGRFLYKLSSPSGRFTPVTNSLIITNTAFPQSFSGNIVSSGTNVPYASVIFFIPRNNSLGNPAALALANSVGAYSIKLPVGTYLLVPFKSNFVANVQSSPTLTLNSSAAIATNLTLTATTRSISGKLVDATNASLVLPGIFLHAVSSDNYLGGGYSDSNGNFTIRATASGYTVGQSGAALGLHGYISPEDGTNVSTISGNVSGLTIGFPQIKALFYGYVKTDLGQPMAGIRVSCSDSNNIYTADAITDQNGYYVAGSLTGEREIQVDNNNPGLTNYIVSQQSYGFNVTNQQVIRQDFETMFCGSTRIATTNLPDGDTSLYYDEFVQAFSCNPNFSWSIISGALPSGLSIDSTTGEISGFPDTPGTNNFTVHVVDGDGHSTNQTFSLIIIGSATPLQVDTFFLPDATNGLPYNFPLAASGGQSPYSWSISPGYANLPANLILNANGNITGTPATNGTYYVVVRVTDDNLDFADSGLLSLTIVNPPLQPLQVTNISLPKGYAGAAYTAQLGATGGLQPYNCWGLALGSASVPPDLTLNCNGSITGVPTTAGTFNFIVQATDGNFTTATKLLGITVNPQPSLSAPAWLTNRFQARLLNGVTGQNYTIQYSLSQTSWTQLLITNSGSTNSFLITDPAATNKQRSYRVLIGP